MHSFRPLIPDVPKQPLDPLAIAGLIDDAMRPGHFFVAPEMRSTGSRPGPKRFPGRFFAADW